MTYIILLFLHSIGKNKESFERGKKEEEGSGLDLQDPSKENAWKCFRTSNLSLRVQRRKKEGIFVLLFFTLVNLTRVTRVWKLARASWFPTCCVVIHYSRKAYC